jgi:dihydrofolate reductase
MGKIVSMINTTPDGFADGPNTIIDAEYFEFTHGLLSEARTIAFGRHTFEQFQNRWPPLLENKDAPEWQVKMAKALNDKHKSAFSSTLKTTSWTNSTIVPKLDAGYLNAYKLVDNGGLLTIGSLSLVAALTEMNLIDDYYFCIQPLIAGKGNIRLFDKIRLDNARPLEYADSKQLKSGVHIIHYQSAF